MSRSSVSVRVALPSDAPVLREVWSDVLRRGEAATQVADLHRVIEDAAASPDRRVVVAEYDGEVAGAVYLRATTLTPINLEETVFALSPHVLPRFRRHGIGSALMEASVRFAEEQGIGHIASAAAADWRDANRFLARLSMVPHAVLRIAPTSVVRGKLAARPGRPSRARSASIDRVLAARRVRRAERVSTV